MDERLRGVAKHFRARVADAAVDDLRARYDFGCVLHAVRYDQGARFGWRAMEELGGFLGAHTSALHRQARVVEVIRPDEFALLLAEGSARGCMPSWSHVESLATVRARCERLELARLVAERGLSVRELAQRRSSRR